MQGMTDRDHFAAAALTGLIHSQDLQAGPLRRELACTMAYRWADAMLRERCRAGADCPLPDNAANLDAAPAAIAGTPGTGDTQEIAAYARFVGSVMNWISEATGFLHDDVLRTDDARDLIHNACMRCWNAFDRIASPTDHGAAPAARASGESVVPQPTPRGDSDRTDKAAPRPSAGTGDTPDSPKPIKGGVSDRSKPINGPDPDSRVWETPVHTPAPHVTPGEGSVPREGTQEPVAWAVCTPGDGDWSPCFFREPHAQRCASAIFGSKNIVPLYRKPTLTDAEAETLRELRDEAAQYADEIGLCASEVRGRQRIIDGLLERLGGGR